MSKQVVEDGEQVTNNYSECFMLVFNGEEANVKTFKKAVTNLNMITSFEETKLNQRTHVQVCIQTPKESEKVPGSSGYCHGNTKYDPEAP